jgi:hypothetical protein
MLRNVKWKDFQVFPPFLLSDLPAALKNIWQGKSKLRNNEHLSNRSSLSQPREGLHEDMVHTKQESCQYMAQIMCVVE